MAEAHGNLQTGAWNLTEFLGVGVGAHPREGAVKSLPTAYSSVEAQVGDKAPY